MACELVSVGRSLFIWQNYDPAVRADLFSTAIATRSGTFLIDPIPLAVDALASLLDVAPIAGVIVTNRNHLRDSAVFAHRFSVPIFAHRDTFPAGTLQGINVADGGNVCGELAVIGIEGAVGGEIALYSSANGGTLCIGDALINFEPYGFTFLPPNYCSDERQMRRSLKKLLAQPVERIFFAHGMPILSHAEERLRELLDVDG